MTVYHRVLLSVYTVVQCCALVDYYCCCFHLTSGTSLAVGPYTVHRNREGFLLSQSTLREQCVEKKYQVFDTIGLLTILVQVNLSSPMERVQKSFLRMPVVLHVVYKNDWSSAFLPGCACVHLPTMTPRVKRSHTYVGVCASLVVVL